MNTFYSHFINKASALRLAPMLSLMVIFFAVGVGTAYGQTQDTIYVSLSGLDGNTGQNPFTDAKRTIGNAITTANNDDVVSIETGDYDEAIATGGGKNLTFHVRNSGTQDSVRITSLTVTNDDTVTISQGDNTANFIVTNGGGLTLGAAEDDKALFNAGASVFKLEENASTYPTIDINGDSSFVTGTLIFPASYNLSYDVLRPYTAGPELNTTLGGGKLTIEADTSFALTRDITVGALDIAEDDGAFDGADAKSPRITGAITITIAPVNATAAVSRIHSHTAANIIYGESGLTALTSANATLEIADTLVGSVSTSFDIANSVVTISTASDTANIFASSGSGGGITVGTGDKVKLRGASTFPINIEGNFINNGTIDSTGSDSTTQLAFIGGSSATFTPGSIVSNTYENIVVAKTGGASVTLTDNLRLIGTVSDKSGANQDTTLYVKSGTLIATNKIIDVAGFNSAVKNLGTINGGEIRFRTELAEKGNDDADTYEPSIQGIGFNALTVSMVDSSHNLLVQDSTTFTGTLKLLKGGVSIASGKHFNLTSGSETIQEVRVTPSRTSAVITGTGTFNNENELYDLNYTGSVAIGDGTANPMIGSEWSAYTRDVTIDFTTTNDTLLFPSVYRAISARNLEIDSVSSIVLAGNASSDNSGDNDTLNVTGNFNAWNATDSKASTIAARNDTLFINLTGSGATHEFGSKFISATSGDDENRQNTNVVINANGASSSYTSESPDFQAVINANASNTSFNFKDVATYGEFKVSPGISVINTVFGSFNDSLILNDGSSLDLLAGTQGDSVDIAMTMFADSASTFDNNGQVVRFTADSSGRVFNLITEFGKKSSTGVPTFTGTGAYRFKPGSNTNDFDANRVSFPNLDIVASSIITSDINITGSLIVRGATTLSDTLTFTGSSLTQSADLTNTSDAPDSRFQISSTTAPTYTVSGTPTVATLKANTSINFSGTADLTITDSLILNMDTTGALNLNAVDLVLTTTPTTKSEENAAVSHISGDINATTGYVKFAGTAGGDAVQARSKIFGQATSRSFIDTLRIDNLQISSTQADTVLLIDSVNVTIGKNLVFAAPDSGNLNPYHASSFKLLNNVVVQYNDTTSLGRRIDGAGYGITLRYNLAGDSELLENNGQFAQDSILQNIGTVSVLDVSISGGSDDSLVLFNDLTVLDTVRIRSGGISERATTLNNFDLTLGNGGVFYLDSPSVLALGEEDTLSTSGRYKVYLGGALDFPVTMVTSDTLDLEIDGGSTASSAKFTQAQSTTTIFGNVELGTSDTLDFNLGDVLNVKGNITLASGATFSEYETSRINFIGDAAQTFSLSDTMSIKALKINNSSGVNITSSIGVTDTLELSSGKLDMNQNTLTLTQGTEDQGYTGGDSTSFVSNGYISKLIRGGSGSTSTAPAQRNYVRYPLGSGTSDFRPLDMYFTDDPVDDITVTAGHFNTSPEGTVFNSSVTDADVTKYPDFYWTLQSSQSLPSSYSFEAHGEAQGYSLSTDQDIDAIKMIYRADGDTSANEWKLLSTSYDNEYNGDDVPVVRAKAATGALKSSKQLLTFGLGADVEYTDTLATFQLTEGGRVGLDTLTVADLDTVFSSSSSLTFSVDTGSVNARIDSENRLGVFADTMAALEESYFDTLTISATDGFSSINARFIVQVNPSPFLKTGATTSFVLSADTVTGNAANYGNDLAGNAKKIALTDLFGGGSDSLFYQVVDTTTEGFFADAASGRDYSSKSNGFADINDRDTGDYDNAFDDTLRIYAATDTALSVSHSIAIKVTDGQVFEADTFYVSFTSKQAPTLRDTIRNFDMTINGSDTSFTATKWENGVGDLSYTLFPSSGDSGAVILDTTNTTTSSYTFTPSDDSTGTVTFTYQATDANGFEVSTTFNVEVLDSVVYEDSIAAFTRDAALGDTTIVDLDSMFAGGDENYTYSAAFSKEGIASASFSDDTVTITPLDSGVVTMTVTATDGNGGADSFETVLTITGTTYTPAFDSALSEIAADTVLLEGESFEFTYSATSSDSADMKYKFATGYIIPSGMSLDSTSGLFTWTPTSYGEYSVKVTAINTNNTDYTNTDEATISVVNAPTFTAELGDTTVATGDTLKFTFAADVYEGGSIASFELDSTYDSKAQINASTGAFSFYPGVTYNGDYDFTVTVTDDKGASATSSFTVNVTQTQAWGNVSGNATLDATDATLVLRHVVGLDTLQGDSLTLADVSGNGTVSSLDASLILRKVVDSDYDFPVEREGNLKAVPATGEFTLANMSGAGEDELALNLSVDQTSGVNALTITINYDAGLNELTAIESALPEGWMFFYNDVQEEGVIKFSAAGVTELTNRDNLITLRFNTMNVEMPSSVNADVTMNEESTSPLADVLLQAIPSEFTLNQNYPNPFNPTTNIKFALPQSSVVKLEVFNVLGQRVATLVNGEMNAGYHTVMFDASNLASGVYVYRINTGEHMQVKRMMLIK